MSAMLADPGGMPGQHMDDLSALSQAVDLANGYGPAIELVNDGFGEGVAASLQRRGQGLQVKRLAREIGRDAGRRGDLYSMAEAYCEVGVEGHRVDLANRPGRDVSDAIELARISDGRFARPCGAADQYGRCRRAYHDAACSHVAESAAARGATPEDSQAWQDALRRHAAVPAADADGQAWRTRRGDLATLADHVEAATGVRNRRSLFEYGPRTAANPGRPEMAAIRRENRFGDPSADPGEAHARDVPRGTAATARAQAAQAGLSTSAGHQAQRDAWKAEHARRAAELARLEDIGGCRAVLAGPGEVAGVLRRIRRRWDVARERNYVEEPKASGYRAVHVIVTRDERRIEVQLRTAGQQQWADAVETYARIFSLPLKDDEGPEELLNYFRLAGEGIYREEFGVGTDEEFRARFDGATAMMRDWVARSREG